MRKTNIMNALKRGKVFKEVIYNSKHECLILRNLVSNYHFYYFRSVSCMYFCFCFFFTCTKLTL